MDDEGLLFVVDRVRDMIVSGGENVYSTEVEQAVAGHAAVAACAVIGMPGADSDERVHAVVVRKAGQASDADAIDRFGLQAWQVRLTHGFLLHFFAMGPVRHG